MEGGLIPQLLKKIGIDPQMMTSSVAQLVRKLPAVSGSGRESGKIYVSQDTDRALTEAERIAERMKDEYVSVEHLFLGLLERPSRSMRKLFESFDLQKNKFLDALQTVRGNARVTSDNPEDTYDVLKKYGQDLTELARQQKLDPVIGRDGEIRNVIRILSRKTKNNPCPVSYTHLDVYKRQDDG